MRDFEVEGTHTFVFKNGLICHQCEDYVLTKMQAIIEAGIIPKENLQVLLCYVANAGYHAVLGIQTTNRGFLISDQRDMGQLWEIEQLKRTHHWDSFSYSTRAGAGAETVKWAKAQLILQDVPIEYMNCNAGAFSDGDEVVVEFTGQDWGSPKVIGFRHDPEPCSAPDIFRMGGRHFLWGLGNWGYTVLTDTWKQWGDWIGPEQRNYASAFGISGSGFVWGGFSYLQSPAPVWDNGLELKKYHEIYILRDYPAPARCFSATFVADSEGYLVGGCPGSGGARTGFGGDFQKWLNSMDHSIYDDVDKYNPIAETWVSLDSRRNRFNCAGFVIGGYGHVVGGQVTPYPDYNAVVTATHERFDHLGQYWEVGRPLSTAVASRAGFAVGNEGFVTDGHTGAREHTWIQTWSYITQGYDNSNHSWSMKQRYPSNSVPFGHGAVSFDNAGWVTGDVGLDDPRYPDYGWNHPIYKYNADSDTWWHGDIGAPISTQGGVIWTDTL